MPGVISCLVVLALALLDPEVAERPEVQWAPWALGLLAFGIPHGALDHRVNRHPRRASSDLVFLAGYLAPMVGVLIVWCIAPIVALIGFLILAAFHFGQGDLYWSRLFRKEISLESNDRLVRTRQKVDWQSALLLLVRGLVPVGLPVLVFADEFAVAADLLAGRLFRDTARWTLPEPVRLGALIGVALLTLVHFATLSREAWLQPSHRSIALSEAAGSALLVGLFSVVPPVLAMGVYFNTWHSVRHVVRLLPVVEPTREFALRGEWPTALVCFHRATLPTTLTALAMMGTLWWFLRAQTGALADFGLAALVMVSALTLPHVLVVLQMDRSQEEKGLPKVWEVRR